MDEVKFVLKCLAFSAVLLLVMQIQVDGVTLEARAQNALVNPHMAEFVNNVAHGGVKLAKDGYQKAVEMYKSKKEERSPDAEVDPEKLDSIKRIKPNKKNSSKEFYDDAEYLEADELTE